MSAETYAQQAFAAVLRQQEVTIDPEMVIVTKERHGSFICTADDPRGNVIPFARGAYFGDEKEGKVLLLTFFDPKIKFWSNPSSWHHFKGTISFPGS